MKPWERRLKDLSIVLDSCHRNYFNPEIFRHSFNQFLQTSRTVTFIIQSNKSSFNDFSNWYDPIIEEWKTNPILKWAKDSRNTIEKVGDLEMYSSISVSLVVGYLEEEDSVITVDDQKLLFYAIKKLHTFLRKTLSFIPDDDWYIKIERKWIANTLPNEEVLQTLNYIYSKQFEICNLATSKLGLILSDKIQKPQEMDQISKDSKQIRYMDSKGPRLKTMRFERVLKDPSYLENYPEAKQFENIYDEISSIEDCFLKYGMSARYLFNRDHFHLPFLFILNKEFKVIDFLGINCNNRAEKFLFWREIAERVYYEPVEYIVHISEMWHRERPKVLSNTVNIDKLKIIGELLVISVMCKNEDLFVQDNIIESNDGIKQIGQVSSIEKRDIPNYLQPIYKVLKKNS